MATEWVRFSVLRYVREVAEFEKSMAKMEERAEMVRSRMEHVMAVRYDRDGSRAGYEDTKPEALDELAEIRDDYEALIMLFGKRAEEAHRLFMRYDETRIVWEKYGEKKTWPKVAREHGYSESGARRCAERGMDIIYELMPEEWRRAPYPAQPREV